jgi:hypothetical protein
MSERIPERRSAGVDRYLAVNAGGPGMGAWGAAPQRARQSGRGLR